MSSGLNVKLDRISRLIDDVLEKEGPLPRDVEEPLAIAGSELLKARGKHPPKEHVVLGKLLPFSSGQRVCVIVQSYTGTKQELIPGAIGGLSSLQLNVMRARVVKSPGRKDKSFEMVGNRPWLFTGDLPVATISMIKRYLTIDLITEVRELFQWETDHWSTWRSYWSNQNNMSTWGTYTVFRDEESE